MTYAALFILLMMFSIPLKWLMPEYFEMVVSFIWVILVVKLIIGGIAVGLNRKRMA